MQGKYTRGVYRSRFGDRDWYDTPRRPPERFVLPSYDSLQRPPIIDQPGLVAPVPSSSLLRLYPMIDEFGREIILRPPSDDDGRRSETPDDPKPRPAPPPPAAHVHAHLSPNSNPAVVEGVSGEQESLAFAATPSANAASGIKALHQDTAGDVDLESFDYSTFDSTSP